MAVTLEDLLPGFTADEAKALLITALQGIGPVQQIGQGAGTLVVTGAPFGSYDAIVQIVVAGAPGTATFNYSLDDGNSFNGPFPVPGDGVYDATGTGLTLTFAGVFDSGDSYLFQTIFPPFPVTDWEPGGIGRTFLEADAAVLADLAGNSLGNIAGGGFVDYASGAGAPNDWLSLLSSQLYNNDRYPAVILAGQIQITLAAGAPTYTYAAGDILFSNTTGNAGQFVYQNASSGSITAGQTLSIPVIAQGAGSAYNLVNGAVTVLLTPQPGLSCNNPTPGISTVTASGGATGTVNTSGAPTANYNVKILCTQTGAAGVGKIQYSLDGGANYNAPQVIPSSGILPLFTLNGQSTGVIVFLTGTFTSADFYTFSAFLSWITTAGQDLESDAALRTRDKGKWTLLGIGGGTSATYDYLARTTPSGGSEVVKTYWFAPTGIGSQINGVVAGTTGPVSSSALSAITAYISARLPLGVKLSLSNATTLNITLVGTVYVVTAQQSAAQQAIQTAISEYIAGIPLGGIVYANEIIAAVENQSASGVINYQQTTPAPNSQQQLTSSQVAALVDFSGLTYVLM